MATSGSLQPTWHINALDCHVSSGSLENIIYTVHWSAFLTDQEHTVSSIGANSIPAPSSGSFIPYEELDKDTVLGWLWEAMGEEQVENITTSLQNQLEEKKVPKTVTFRPDW